MSERLPHDVLYKPKQGFSIPLKHWLRGSLKPMMTDLLSPEKVRQRGYFNPECVNGWMEDHLNGVQNHSHRLWALMVFEIWNQQFMDGGSWNETSPKR
jgi:asparagine synthase (glutamine-hydrolysing)